MMFDILYRKSNSSKILLFSVLIGISLDLKIAIANQSSKKEVDAKTSKYCRFSFTTKHLFLATTVVGGYLAYKNSVDSYNREIIAGVNHEIKGFVFEILKTDRELFNRAMRQAARRTRVKATIIEDHTGISLHFKKNPQGLEELRKFLWINRELKEGRFEFLSKIPLDDAREFEKYMTADMNLPFQYKWPIPPEVNVIEALKETKRKEFMHFSYNTWSIDQYLEELFMERMLEMNSFKTGPKVYPFRDNLGLYEVEVSANESFRYNDIQFAKKILNDEAILTLKKTATNREYQEAIGEYLIQEGIKRYGKRFAKKFWPIMAKYSYSEVASIYERVGTDEDIQYAYLRYDFYGRFISGRFLVSWVANDLLFEPLAREALNSETTEEIIDQALKKLMEEN